MKTRPAGIGNVNADWMGSLPSKLSAMPLKHLAVPGSHDSFTFWVDVHAPVGPDQKVYVKYLATIFRVLAKKVMVKWSMTQNLTFKEQLDTGIRYFDLRVSSKSDEPGNEIYFIHGLFGHKVRDGLLEISSFLGRHRKEVVFLDFNYYYAMDTEHHVYLINMLQEVFGRKLCNNCAVESVTLDYLWEKKYQIAQKYDLQKEEELRFWIEEVTGMCIGENFQKGLKDGVIGPGTRRDIFDQKVALQPLDNSTISLQMGTNKVASQRGMSVYGLGRQVFDPKYCAPPTEPVIHTNGSQGTGTNCSEISDSDYQAEFQDDDYHRGYHDEYSSHYNDQSSDY